MIYEILAIIGGSTTAALVVATITLAFKLSSAKDDERTATQQGVELSHALDAMTKDRDRLATLSDVRAVQLAELTRRIEDAETARNVEARKAVIATVERIKAANAAEAAKIGNDILMKPLGKEKKP